MQHAWLSRAFGANAGGVAAMLVACALFVLGDITGALGVLYDIARLAERAGDAERLGRACAYLANAHFMLGNPERGIELAGRGRTRSGHQNHRPSKVAIDGVMNERTISVSNSRPSAIVVPI